MNPKANHFFALTLIAASALLTACSEAPAPSPENQPQAAAPAATMPAEKAKGSPFIMVAGIGKPQDATAYKEPRNSNHVGWLFHAHAQSPTAAEDAIELILPYAEEGQIQQILINTTSNDPFVKRDNMPKALAFAEEKIKEAAQAPWYKMMMPADLESYDFDRKGFQFKSLAFSEMGSNEQDAALFYMDNTNRYGLGFSNGPQVKFVKIEDEGLARKIQDLLTNRRLYVSLNGEVGAVQLPVDDRVRAVMMKVHSVDLYETDGSWNPVIKGLVHSVQIK